eukprot:31499-Pelagococcus_subviridis.AAC.38
MGGWESCLAADARKRRTGLRSRPSDVAAGGAHVHLARDVERRRRGVHVLVAAPAAVQDDLLPLLQRRHELLEVGEGVRRLERGDDPLASRHSDERVERLLVRHRVVLRASEIFEERVLRADAGVVQTGGDAVRLDDLPLLVLDQVRKRAVQDAGRTERERRRVLLPRSHALARGLDADDPHVLVVDELVEQTHRVRAAADARDQHVRLASPFFERLRPRLLADHRVEVANHHRVRVRARDGPEDVVRRLHVRDPVADRLGRRVLERRGPRAHGRDRRAEKTHPEDVELLALHVRGAHVDDALEAEARAHGRGGDAVLPRARLRDDALLPHSLREEGLADGVVDLVRARVVEVLTLEVDVRGAVELREPLREVQRVRAADVVLQDAAELSLWTGGGVARRGRERGGSAGR